MIIDFSGIILNADKLMQSDLNSFHLEIMGLYAWGVGYVSEGAQRLYDDLIDAIERSLSDLFPNTPVKSKPANAWGGCYQILGTKDKSYVYCHPMEFTGYLSTDNIEIISQFVQKYLNRRSEQYVDEEGRLYFEDYHPFEVMLLYANPVADMSDDDYMQVLKDNEARIAQKIKGYYSQLTPKQRNDFLKYEKHEVATDFCSTGRVNRAGDKRGVICSDDIDYEFIMDLFDRMIASGDFDK